MYEPSTRIKDVVIEALTNRGFSRAEATQIVRRLASQGEEARFDLAYIRVPFGKYRGERIVDIPRGYLYWLTTQEWFREQYYDLFDSIKEILA